MFEHLSPSRRQFLSKAVAATVALATPHAFANSSHYTLPEELSFDLTKDVRSLKLLRQSTNELLHIDYMQEGTWAPQAYSRICWALRDVRANQWVQMDLQLVAILDWTQRYLSRFGYDQPLVILSGYRTQATNSELANSSRNSMHLYGKAVDFTVPGLSPKYLAQLMQWLSQGGVGAYANKGFVHIDTGRVRNWSSR